LPALHLPTNDPGRPGTVGVPFVRPVGGYVDISRYYCTLGDDHAPPVKLVPSAVG
jgi:hypothetical protein